MFGPCLCTKSCKTTFYAHLSRILELIRFTPFIRKFFATKILLSGKFLLFVTLQWTFLYYKTFALHHENEKLQTQSLKLCGGDISISDGIFQTLSLNFSISASQSLVPRVPLHHKQRERGEAHNQLFDLFNPPKLYLASPEYWVFAMTVF